MTSRSSIGDASVSFSTGLIGLHNSLGMSPGMAM